MQYFLRGLLTISAVLLGSTGRCGASCCAGEKPCFSPSARRFFKG